MDYLLDSTLQSSGKYTRINVRLLDLRAGSDVVWARRFDREVDDVLVLQGEIAAETAAQIDLELLLREGERRISGEAGETTAFDLTLRAIPAIYRLEPSGFHAAGELLEAAVAMEPGSATAHAWWAYWHLFLVGQAWAKDPVAAALRAGELRNGLSRLIRVTLVRWHWSVMSAASCTNGPRRHVPCMSVRSR